MAFLLKRGRIIFVYLFSKTIELLQLEKGELYVQSPAYVYDLLLKELGLYPIYYDADITKMAEP